MWIAPRVMGTVLTLTFEVGKQCHEAAEDDDDDDRGRFDTQLSVYTAERHCNVQGAEKQ